MQEPKILLFDIESTGLKADFANLLTFGYKFLGEKGSHVVSVLDVHKPCGDCGRVDTTSDSKLIKKIYPIIASADALVGYYSKGFDIKFLNTVVLDAGLKPLPPIPHIDIYWTIRSNFALTSNRLANVQEFLKLRDEKTQLKKRVWRKAQSGHVPSIRYINHHCKMDVLVLEGAYLEIRPYVRLHPRFYGANSVGECCRVCGYGRMRSKGLYMTSTKGKRRQLRCNRCGHVETLPA